MTSKPQARQVDVARLAGVSQAAVSAVLNGRDMDGSFRVSPDKAKSIRDIARKLGYRPNPIAQQLKGQRTGVIGVLMAASTLPMNYERLAAVEGVARARGCRIMVSRLAEDTTQIDATIGDLEARRLDGLICLHHALHGHMSLIPKRLSAFKNVVFIDRPNGIENPCFVETDFADGTKQAVEHLIGKGRKRIALAYAGRDRDTDPWNLREAGYDAAMKRAGLAVNPKLKWFGNSDRLPLPQYISAIVDEMIIPQRAEALLASNDHWAVELIKALKRRGIRTPEDIAVIGHDNVELAHFFDPALTTIDQSTEQMAIELVDRLYDMVQGKPVEESRRMAVVKPHLVVRESA